MIGTGRTIVVSFNGQTVGTGTTAIALSSWTYVSVYIFASNSGAAITAYASIYQNLASVVSGTSTPPATVISSFKGDQSGDIFKIGGFIGEILSLQVVYRGQGSLSSGKIFKLQNNEFNNRFLYGKLSDLQRWSFASMLGSYLHYWAICIQ